ncbi:uncharacterized protein LOC118464659 [Anopheles albimanus]|uniref:Uncharacterized protein n=1 Tax=Anopheles albimanus TaxID=7167 RepID=A0A182FFC1_ANOAL|nr:uncharacterized protein LOC118464659 [Anopheles albimanus]
MSFCRITGKCRSLPKPNYFPMLPPISPAAAKRFCRVTGKSYGLPSHHFIPVMLVQHAGRDRCKITNVAAELEPHHYQPGVYGCRKHAVICAFRYVLPLLDESDEAQRNLTAVLQQKRKPIEQSLYVYRVDERSFGLVFPAQLEAAVRDGDVRDVMLAKESDKLLIKLRKGNSVSVALQSVEPASTMMEELYEGEGPRADVIKLREKEEAKRPKPKPRSTLSSIANIFEQKEKIQDEQLEEEQRFIEEHREKAARLATERRERQLAEKLRALQLDEHLLDQEADLGDLVKPLIESWDWSTLEREAAAGGGLPNKLEALPELLTVPPVTVEPYRPVQLDARLLERCSGLEAASYVGTIVPAKVELAAARTKALAALTPEALGALAQLEERLGGAESSTLPHLDDLASVVAHLHQAQPTEVNGVPGVRLIVNHQSVFVPGQMVLVAAAGGKPTFVPGQSMPHRSADGAEQLEFVPGVTITGHDGTIQFIPGEIAPVRPASGQPAQPTFVAGRSVDGGARFVCGQVLQVGEEARFVQGQTIVTPEGVTKFIAGVVDERTGAFVPGQPIETPDGLRFMPGQTITVHGKERFIPGQNVTNALGELVFVPGQTVTDGETGTGRFVPGKTIVTAEGAKFVPGQYVGTQFVPGIADGARFVPGVNIETKEGSKFIEGQIVHSRHGDVFMPGTTTVGPDGQVSFEIASTIDAVRFGEATPVGLVVDSEQLTIGDPSLCVFGHLVQNEAGVEFYPERISKEHLPSGKIVPGKLVKQLLDSKFIPGIKTEDDGFIPGQVVMTDRGEQFVPGQVIETSEGMKFVPGQIIETKSGPKFVPGQTMETPDGPRFVPGQIINTKAGPTFIPGQVISTDDDGEKFVPGQIVDTDDGPRFVPGRVVETENKVTFIPGRIVETADGPRFVAPDLKDNEDGDEEFLVQSFTVTPEELKLLKPSQPAYGGAISGESSLVVSLDSTILQSLAQSGMPIGRQVEASAVDYVLESTKERKALQQFLADSQLPGVKLDVLEGIFDGLKSICRKVDLESLQYSGACEAAKEHGERVCNGSIGVVEALATNLATILTEAATLPEGQGKTMYEIIAEAIKASTGGEYSLDELQHVVETPEAIDYLFGVVNRTIVKNNIDQKLRTLTALLDGEEGTGTGPEHSGEPCPIDQTGAIEEFCQLLDNGGMSEAFVNLLKKDEHLFKSIVTSLKSSGVVEDSVNISEILQTALVDSIQERAQAALVELIEDPRSQDALRTLLKKSEGLAHALGHSKEAETFQYLLTHPTALRDLHKDDELFTIINRVLIMEQLAEDDDEYRELMDSLERTPSHATKSDKLRELIRQSGALSYAPARKIALETSKDVPLSLFYTNNQLAIEEFFLKSGQSGQQSRSAPKAFLIIKRGFQAVIPRESSHEVLAGKIAYTVLDEDGIRYFQPMNVLSALRITPKFLNRFSMYTCEFQEEPDCDTFSSHSSSHDGLDSSDSVLDETAYFYRPLSRRSSLRYPLTNGERNGWNGTTNNGGRKLERHESFSPRMVRRKMPPLNGYHAGSGGTNGVHLPPQHRPVSLPQLQHQHQHHHHQQQHYASPLTTAPGKVLPHPKLYSHAQADNVKTLPMAMRIAIKASLASSASATCYRSSSRDSIHRTSSRANVPDWSWK